MKIGVFDSGLGGLVILQSLITILPEYDFVYLGDNARTPYGNRSQEVIYDFAKQAVDALFRRHECGLVITACNTVSAEALRRLQIEYLPRLEAELSGVRRVLGVIKPVVEEIAQRGFQKIGLIATRATVNSGAYERELKKLIPDSRVFSSAAPLLVSLIEEGWIEEIETEKILKKYLQPLIEQNVEVLIPACTHYPILMDMMRASMPKSSDILDAPLCVANSLKNYLGRHAEMDSQLSRRGLIECFITDYSPAFKDVAGKLFNKEMNFSKTVLGS